MFPGIMLAEKAVLVLGLVFIWQVTGNYDCYGDDYDECPPGEYLDECATEWCEGEYCQVTDKDPTPAHCPAADPEDCYVRCKCNEGLLRNETGDCVLPAQCPPIQCTGKNEELASCQPTCPNELCASAPMSPARCALVPRIPVRCKPTCRCIKDHFRDEHGKCVPFKQCPVTKCPPGEYLNTCPPQFCSAQLCPTSSTSPRSCPAIKPCGTPKCTCNFNTRRNRFTGGCIPIEKCPAFPCPGSNEEFQACSNPYVKESCSAYLANATRPPFRIGIAVECDPQCRCKQDFYRNESGVCVKASECKPTGCKQDPNAEQGCGVPCGRTCKLYNKGPVPCPKICRLNACDCKKGYVLNEDTKKCVKPEECPQNTTGCKNDPNATRGCGNPCGRTCKLKDKKPMPCSHICKVDGCNCNEGFVLNEDTGKCVLPKQCPVKCLGAHEFWSCGPACDNVCATMSQQNRTSCPIKNKKCSEKCYCEDGHARDEHGVCIPVAQCKVAALVSGSSATQDNEQLFTESTAKFDNKAFSEVADANEGKSIIFSSFSLEPLLALLSLGADGLSHEQILTALGFPDDNFTRSIFPSVINKLSSTKGVTLKLATSLYVPEGYKLNTEFERDARERFNSLIQNVDFGDSVNAAKTINTWVADNTNNKIKDLVSPDSLNDLTRLVLCNAVYFKGQWKVKFDPKLTKDHDFYVSSTKTVKIPMMAAESNYKYYESSKLDAKLLEIPYSGEEASMLIVLPNQKDGLQSLLAKFKESSGVLEDEMKNMYSVKVQVKLPKWRTETTTDLKDVFKKIGITQIFDEANSGLVKLLQTVEKLYVTKATQKAFIEVNEEGTEAAAANAITAVATSAIIREPRKIIFVADHPFFYSLKSQNLSLFSGTVAT